MVRLLAGALAALLTFSAHAVTFYTDEAAFNAAVSGKTLVGTETWSQTSLPANALDDFIGPIEYGVSVENFPTGGAIPDVRYQDNNDSTGLFEDPTPSTAAYPRGLAIATAGAAQTPDPQVSNAWGPGFDVIFDGTLPTAVSMLALFFDAWFWWPEYASHGNVTVQVFDASNVLVGTTVLADCDYRDPSCYVGIVEEGGIGRINLRHGLNSWGFSGNYAGADNVKVYSD